MRMKTLIFGMKLQETGINVSKRIYNQYFQERSTFSFKDMNKHAIERVSP